jgi:uncharacterized membrane protein YcaP (DUF421 family)
MIVFIKSLIFYLLLIIVFKIIGRRSLAQMTSFDLILSFIIGRAAIQAIMGDDYSITNSVIVIITYVGIEAVFTFLKNKSKSINKLILGVPLILVENSNPYYDRMKKSHISMNDILSAARKDRGIENLEDIKYAILENNGEISIIPKKQA